ncbi:MAG: hypothetical protein FJ146_06670 [Deltaproteobacteria bacterium]|nr:hypothetical protein [Deltaproteobacteria bacterium]
MGYMRRFAPMFALFVAFACHNDPSGKDADVNEKSKVCVAAGATLSATTNECECAGGSKWTGSRCDSEAGSKDKAQLTEAQPATLAPQVSTLREVTPATLLPENKAKDGRRSGIAKTDKADAQVQSLTPHQLAALKTNCEKAHAKWMGGESYCLCPEHKVLVGAKCQAIRNQVSDAACTSAVRPGRWSKGDCRCSGGETFIPERGGCVAAKSVAGNTLKFTCENGLNSGKWDDSKNRCNCPSGRIWWHESCALMSRLSSSKICESEFHGGSWDGVQKRCQCPKGRMWLNQSCLDPHALPSRNVCESEWNRGTWNQKRQSCACPRGGQWNSKNLTCTRRAG